MSGAAHGTIAGAAWGVSAHAASGFFDGQTLAVVTAGTRLRLWSVGRDARACELCCELPWPHGAVLCMRAVPMAHRSKDLLFVLSCNMRWQLLGLEPGSRGRACGGPRLAQRLAGSLTPPAGESATTLFGRDSVQCCGLPAKRGGGAVVFSVWDRWLTVLDFSGPGRQTDLPLLAGSDALPVSGDLPPRVIQLSTWAADATACTSACDAIGNFAVAVLYADDSLRLLHVASINLDLDSVALLPGPWSLQNIGITELEQECALIPVGEDIRATSTPANPPSGVLVIGQGARATYLSGDGEMSAQSTLPSACGSWWTGCQLPPDEHAGTAAIENGRSVVLLTRYVLFRSTAVGTFTVALADE